MDNNENQVIKLNQNIVELNGKLELLMSAIDSVKEKQDEMAEHISKIKEAVYNPDQGIYARIKTLEQWKETHSKAMWIVFTGVTALVLKQVWDIISLVGTATGN